MSSFGSISAMLTSLKNNKIPKRDNKLGHLEYKKGVPIGKPLKFKNKMTREEITKFTKRLIIEKRKKTRQTIVIYSVSIGTISYLIFHNLY